MGGGDLLIVALKKGKEKILLTKTTDIEHYVKEVSTRDIQLRLTLLTSFLEKWENTVQSWQFFFHVHVFIRNINEETGELIVKCALKASKVTDCSAPSTFQVCMHVLEGTTSTQRKVLYFSGEQSNEDPN